MPKLPPQGRTKAKYCPRPNAAEKRYERYVKEQPCFGCGRHGVSAHHTLLNFEGKRWRRDHQRRLPVCWDCHQGRHGIHGIGDESKWLAGIDRTEAEAIELMERLWRESNDRFS